MKVYKLWGVKLEREDFDAMLRFGRGNASVNEFIDNLPYNYEEKDRVEFVKLLINKTPILVRGIIFVEDKKGEWWLGRDFSTIHGEETGSKFREDTRIAINAIVGSGKTCEKHDIVIEE